ncbi:DUF1365 domain-containing protein [Yinghuangia sp. YIM S09857]|uniref:DUF1365 domain-containing protein n=1 Tax=Yinghuangia sp. YIM S09857 TaxID=3436929 RepID=UPI003F537D31
MTESCTSPIRQNALYRTEVVHVRLRPPQRRFRSPGYTWLVDLDTPVRLPWILRPFARFETRDHLGDPALTIRANVEAWLAGHDVHLAGGRILMLANARVLGHVFNPLTVYWCHHRDGHLACVVAEVHNTYGERHRYLLRPGPDERARTDKAFYVSPFLAVDGYYDIRAPEPGERFHVSVTLHQGGRPAFTAHWRGRRVPATAPRFAALLARFPLQPQRVTAGIRAHGLRLWLRGVPVVPRAASARPEPKPRGTR